jgi:hypothetical protein
MLSPEETFRARSNRQKLLNGFRNVRHHPEPERERFRR